MAIQATYKPEKAESMDEQFDRIVKRLEKMMPTSKPESEPAYKKKAEKFDKEFDRSMSMNEDRLRGLQTSNSHPVKEAIDSLTPSPEPELCVSIETDMLSKGTTAAIEVDEDSSKPELESKAYLSPVYVDRSNDDDQVSLDLVLLSDSALVEIMPKSKQTLMSAKTDMESFVAVFDYKTKHMTVNESESLLALINSENLCVKHVRQYASEYILPVEVGLPLLCWLQLWKGIKGVQRCLYVKLVDGNYVYDKGKSDMYDNEWYGVVVKENMKVKRDAVTYNSLLVALNKYKLLSYSLPNQRSPSLPPENDLKINVSDDVVAELENGVDSLFESFARFHSHMLSVGQNAGKIRGHAEIIQVMLKQVSDVLLQWAADETRHINLTDVGIHLSLLVYIPRISVSSGSNSVADDPELWVHESAGLLRPVFRILEMDQAA